MAAPHVSGAAALALSRYPDWSAQDLTRMLLNAVDPIQPNKPMGSGRLNVWRAQQVVARLPRGKFNLSEKVGALIDFEGSADGEHFSHYDLSVGQGASPADWLLLHHSDTPRHRIVFAHWF